MPSSERRPDALNLLTDLIGKARRAGADAADAVHFAGISQSASYRLGKTEDIERAEGSDLGLRVFIGKRQAFVSSSDASPQALGELLERAIAMARNAPEDRYCGLADPARLAKTFPDLDLADDAEPTVEALVARARVAEEAALAVKGVTNSEGAGADWGRSRVALATSDGFAAGYAASHHGVSVSVIAGDQAQGMERDYDFASARHLSDLAAADAVGRHAGEQAIKRVGPRKVPSCKVPVVYAPRVALSLLGHLAGAIAGPSITRGTSFLKDRLHERVFAPGIRVVDDPHRRRGMKSRPFDGEGVANAKLDLVADGRLTTWLLDSASARQLGLASTGHASRGTASPPSPSTANLYLEPGGVTPDELIDDIVQGFYVTELIGMGVNGVTGDYSRGAAGFWIENGKITYPVSELTIAGNLKDMFRHMAPANDLVFKYGTDSPTVRVEGMTVAGT
jgi:PmbA protein